VAANWSATTTKPNNEYFEEKRYDALRRKEQTVFKTM
jgi:hypothetical protein